MISSVLFPRRFRGEQPQAQPAAPSWISKKSTPILQFFSSLACSHPIHTVVIVAVLASSSYVGLLQESLFDAATSVRKADWSSLTEGSRRLQVSPETNWKWQNVDQDVVPASHVEHLALLTLVFPESHSAESANTAPRAHAVPFPQNLSVTPLPQTSNSLTAYSQDSALAFSLPYDQAPEFLASVQEIPDDANNESRETQHGHESKMWIMKAARVNTKNSYIRWVTNGWTEFLDLLKNAETLDIVIMVLGYLSMHLTFVSLFLSMRRMGSNFWLFTNVLFSSVFAFLFGLIVTTKLGVPISMVLLSEGLPFLVVTIGFEKNIVLTRAVLSHAIEHRRPQDKDDKKSKKKAWEVSSSNVIQYAVQAAIKENGYEIVRDYAVEIGVLILGAASGVQGGLQQFCFLAAWILFFDCILLFSFYTAILSIKLEINRIKRHVQMRRALEDDGVSRRVAENVASGNDWPGSDDKAAKDTSLFGKQMKGSNVPKFKALMVTGFVLINICRYPIYPASTEDESDALAMRQIKSSEPSSPGEKRSFPELDKMLAEKRAPEMTDDEIVAMSMRGKIPGYALERTLKDFTRAVKIRRSIISQTKATSDITNVLERSKLPYEHYNWERVFGACCENVIGYMPLPVGVAGPLVIDGVSYFIPMATTEGVLVASTSRGCKAINSGGGAVTVLTGDGMTRGPCVSFETLERAGAAKIWLDSEAGHGVMKKAFNSTSNFARLQSMKTAIAGTKLYIRFKTTTGDAMGMNMISKGVEHALDVMMSEGFEDMNIVSVSGNFCIDKKPAAINWIDGRGKSVVAEAIIPADVVRDVLKSDVDTLVELNISKNLIGSAMAASVGGFNAHAANIVAAIFLATGQDPAQVVESANCITIMQNLRGSLQISVSMPSIEVGTLGGGTILEPQSAMLDMLGVRGPHPTTPGENARRLARIVAAATLAGELSLCSALAAGHLVKAHMQHNRSAPPTRSTTPAPASGTMTPVGLAMTSAVEKAASSSKLSAAATERARR
ncbi:3-hydroxy-3-methylglutaryl-coenzyme A reductase [Verticillium dahliae VdLs.17]|uniref:3-hydroxy-3-methylglutaryl coenzyme A reductase n=1 Tax=Verticillium dahliae (strain VdLs.17 / ATCC MYA-4575 / FGSC 10137) TaxID=498257 RepID=G2X8M8_VERDV|nr:3-hydroxy-3-methylglutaryl-coenzyme A reductase [Verticillium dahliae VdLs.17]EGY15315.1 3-hydroxy-3-methylglutaryl-coenzyme A reductase [Verticillium dahliae VdLs.17]